MKKEIIDHVKKLKDQGADVKVDEDQINDLINKIFNEKYEKYERETSIESEIDKFLEKNGDKNISISYDKNKNKFNTEKITKSLKKLRNKLINPSEFKEEHNKFLDSIEKIKNFKSEKKSQIVFLQTKKKIRYARDLKDIVDLYNLKSDSDTSKKGEGLP